jgi:molybdopterin/thiamine biosynthesis adenylyltransferase
LRNCRVAIIGMGGVGGVHLITLTRLGIGKFTIADPDTYELANFNRQYGANTRTLGRPKVEVMAEAALAINPELDIRVLQEPIGKANVREFLDGADLLVDGLELYAIDVRRVLFRTAAQNGLFAITAGPVGFSTAWLVFDPDGMTFDRYFDLCDGMDYVEKMLAFLVGASPAATQLAYMDLSFMSMRDRIAPATGFACHLAAGVAAAEALKILLHKGRVRSVPYFQQFDPYLQRFVKRKLIGANRHPWQRLKRWWLYRQYRAGTATWADGQGRLAKTHGIHARLCEG